MSTATLEKVYDTDVDIYDDEYDDDEGKTKEEIWAEVMAEVRDMEAHPEKYKRYTSTKEMFRDMGFDVSNFPDR